MNALWIEADAVLDRWANLRPHVEGTPEDSELPQEDVVEAIEVARKLDGLANQFARPTMAANATIARQHEERAQAINDARSWFYANQLPTSWKPTADEAREQLRAPAPKHDGWRESADAIHRERLKVAMDDVFARSNTDNEDLANGLDAVHRALTALGILTGLIADPSEEAARHERIRSAGERVMRARDELAEALEDAPDDLGSLRAKIREAIRALRIDSTDLPPA